MTDKRKVYCYEMTAGTIGCALESIERIEKEDAMKNLFTADNFASRRTTGHNLYDPEALLTGAEMAAGLDYDCPRQFPSEEVYIACCNGTIPVEKIPEVAPRVRRS